jgi:hypothetical protein
MYEYEHQFVFLGISRLYIEGMHYNLENKQPNTKVARNFKMFTDYVIDFSALEMAHAEDVLLCMDNNVSTRMMMAPLRNRFTCYELMSPQVEGTVNGMLT